jgi:hypothetical protein
MRLLQFRGVHLACGRKDLGPIGWGGCPLPLSSFGKLSFVILFPRYLAMVLYLIMKMRLKEGCITMGRMYYDANVILIGNAHARRIATETVPVLLLPFIYTQIHEVSKI